MLLLRFQLEGEMSAPPSASGGILESLRVGMAGPADSSADWRRQETSTRRAVTYGDVLLLTQDLDDREIEVCRCRYWLPLDGHESRLRSVPDGDLHVVSVGERAEDWRRSDRRAGAVPLLDVRMTLDGDEYVRPADVVLEPRAHGDGSVAALAGAEITAADGFSLVREIRARMTSYRTIAERMSLTEHQVRRVIQSSHRKVDGRLDRVRLAGDTE